jgi:serine/threonine protein phosphatase 1
MPAPRVLAIGDIHGCLNSFKTLLELVAPTALDTVVTLGDYVDRGPDSAGVLTLLGRMADHPGRFGRLVCIRGNHEQMMLEARDGPGELEVFRNVGGDATLASYSPVGDEGRLEDVPAEHWALLEHYCVDWFETATHFFVHAGAYADLPLYEQPTHILRWEVFNDPPPHESGKVMVCGHTPQRSGEPRNIGHAVCIDTRAFRPDKGGWLTCLDTTTGRVWQANEFGQTRTAWLDDFLVSP